MFSLAGDFGPSLQVANSRSIVQSDLSTDPLVHLGLSRNSLPSCYQGTCASQSQDLAKGLALWPVGNNSEDLGAPACFWRQV